jgi:hypothetical protein
MACAECLLIRLPISYTSDGERLCLLTSAWIVASTSCARWPNSKKALRSGDIWVQGSRQFKDFDEYLIPSRRFSALRESNRLSLAVGTDCEAYLKDRLCRPLRPVSVS